MARELGVDYFETSVLTYYGVDQMFENAIRTALIARRKKFWMTNLKRVNRPMLQVCTGGGGGGRGSERERWDEDGPLISPLPWDPG